MIKGRKQSSQSEDCAQPVMPPPLAPQHYAERLSQSRRSAFSTGWVVQLFRAGIYLALVAVVAAIGWWYYTLQNYPQKRILWTADGQTIHADVLGRTDTLFKYLQASDGGEYFIPIAALSEWDQLMTKLMPVNMSINYPVDCTLRDTNGRTVNVRIQGHTVDSVTFTLADSRGTFNYPFAKLSAQDQAWIQLLPIFAPEVTANVAVVPSIYEPDPKYVAQLQQQIDVLQQDIRNYKALYADPINSGIDRQVYQNEANNAQAEINFLKRKIEAIQQGKLAGT
jgi:hypothetical protein